jgi:hypothetical protein
VQNTVTLQPYFKTDTMYPVHGSSYGIIMDNRIDFRGGKSVQPGEISIRDKKEELGWMMGE